MNNASMPSNSHNPIGPKSPLTQWILGPVWQSILLASLCYVFPMGDLFAIVIQVFVTLRQGMQKGFVVTLGSTLLGVTLGFLVTSLFVDINYSLYVTTLRWALTLSLPLWLFAGVLRATVSLAFTTQALTIAFMALFAISYSTGFNLFPSNLQKPLYDNINSLTTQILEVQKNANIDEGIVITPENINMVNSFLMSVFEVVTVYVLYLTLLLIARAWQSAVFNPSGFKREFIHIQPGNFITTILVCFWLIALLFDYVALEFVLAGVLFVGGIWLCFCGIAFVHWVISTFELPWLAVILFYLALLVPFLSGLMLFLLILTGLISGFVDLRALALKLKSANN